MKQDTPRSNLTGKLVMLGFGSIGQAILPLVFRHLGVKAAGARIVKTSEDRSGIAKEFGVVGDRHRDP